jgi:hypothetical protein
MKGKAAEAPERGVVLQGFSQLAIGEVVTVRQQQGSEQGQWWPRGLALGGATDVSQAPVQGVPVDQP